nr:DDE-type integrase/transposase/recombinase [Rhodococcus sp. BH4]
MSLRDVEELMFERGVVVSHQTIRQWCAMFGRSYANELRLRRPRPGNKWYLDEVFTSNQRRAEVFVARGRSGRPDSDAIVQSGRNATAAKRFFRKVLKGLRYVPTVLVTAKLASYKVAYREMLTSAEHRRSKYFQQSGRELASANATMGAPGEENRFSRAGATVHAGCIRLSDLADDASGVTDSWCVTRTSSIFSTSPNVSRSGSWSPR